jgi:hypothetical protein
MTVVRTGAAAGVRSTLVMPSKDECRKLYRLVYGLHPRLDPRKDRDFNEAAHDRAFFLVFQAVGLYGRGPIDTKKAVTWWADGCRNMLADDGFEVDVGSNMLATVVLAHGDIPHQIIFQDPKQGSSFPLNFGVGLMWMGSGVPARDAWRRVIETGALRKASLHETLPTGWRPTQQVQMNRGYGSTGPGLISSEDR